MDHIGTHAYCDTESGGKGSVCRESPGCLGETGQALATSCKHGELTIPLSPKNASGYYEVIREQRIFLEFEAVMQLADVWGQRHPQD
jgi:hypothetical protein